MHTHESSKEDGDHLPYIGGDHVSDELLGVGKDAAALGNGGDYGGEVVVSQDHISGMTSYCSARAHCNADVRPFQSRSIVDSVSRHCDYMALHC